MRRRCHRRPGPLAVARFPIAVTVAFLVAGDDAWRAVEHGTNPERALLLGLAGALLTWIGLGRIDRIVVDAQDQRSP